MPAAPDVPTFNEQGIPGMDLTSWIAFVGPAKMPAELVARVNALLVQALSAPDVKEFYYKGAWEAAPSTPAELTHEMRVAYDRWGQMIRQIGFEKQ
jgi:tripartite-type tricarboxylate transporter receptor subunit TctC